MKGPLMTINVKLDSEELLSFLMHIVRMLQIKYSFSCVLEADKNLLPLLSERKKQNKIFLFYLTYRSNLFKV